MYMNQCKQVLLILSVLVPGFVVAGPAQAQPQDKTLLWQIEGEGIYPSYLLGTIHILPQSEFVLKEKVIQAFEKSRLLVLELDLDNPDMQADIMQHAGMRSGETLDQLLPQAAYRAIDGQLKEVLGVGIQAFNTFKPALIASFLTARYLGEQPASFELTLMQMAQQRELDIEGLESVADQMAVFDQIPYMDQAEDLVEMVEEEEKTKGIYKRMLDLYIAEDQQALYKMMGEYFDDAKEFELMIPERNKKWIPIIEMKARNQTTFFGVGAGHLGGEDGVLALLQKAGYKVTPIM